MEASRQAELSVEPPAVVGLFAHRELGSLVDGEPVEGAYAIRDRSRRPTKRGGEWLKLVLSDSSGSTDAKVWDRVEERHEICRPGAVVWVSGRYEVSAQWGSAIVIDRVRAALAEEYDPADLIGGGPIPIERLERKLRELLETIQTPDLRALLDRFFGLESPRWSRIRIAPAAKHYHQAFVHGLLDHTVSVAEAVSAAAATFGGIDRDVAVTGALLHDIGKTEAYNDDPLAIDLTDLGRLHGEIPLGYYMVRREIESIGGFDPGLAKAVLHIILSHHGKLEHGSPVVPATREATLVHAMDNLGGTLGSFDRIESALPDGEAWLGFDRALGGGAYFGGRAAPK